MCVCDDSALSWQLQWSINLLEQLSYRPRSWGESSHQKLITQTTRRGQRPPKGASLSPLARNRVRTPDMKRSYLLDARVHLHILLSQLSRGALQSINQQTWGFIPQSSIPVPGPLRGCSTRLSPTHTQAFPGNAPHCTTRAKRATTWHSWRGRGGVPSVLKCDFPHLKKKHPVCAHQHMTS